MIIYDHNLHGYLLICMDDYDLHYSILNVQNDIKNECCGDESYGTCLCLKVGADFRFFFKKVH